jgi:DNA-binding MarR family transcriptional regulator
MAKSQSRLRHGSPVSDGKNLQGHDRATAEKFPPLSVSLEAFVKDGTDREFRKLIYALMSLANLMLRNSKHFADYIAVTEPQWAMMVHITESDGATVGSIAERMNVSSQFVTIEINKLMKKNIVEKRPNEADRRSMFLVLTPKGQALLRELAPLRRRTNDMMFRSLTEDRAKVLQELVSTLVLDGKSALHALEAPHIRGKKAPSALSEMEVRIAANEGVSEDAQQNKEVHGE